MTSLPPGHERRYMSERASVAHVVATWSSLDAATWRARCGKYPPFPDGWRGTGSHTERARAASLPLCRTCNRLTP